MPSSISSSSPREVQGPWRWTWGLALLLAISGLGALEIELRGARHRPSVVDDEALWSIYRESVTQAGPGAVVLIGSSRIQLAFDLHTFSQAYPEHPVFQLAIPGKEPMAVLHDLATDTRFQGLIIADVTETSFLPRARVEQQSYVAYFHRRFNLNERVNRRMKTWLQERLVFLSGDLRLEKILSALFTKGTLPDPWYITTYSNRTRFADYAGLKDLPALRKQRIEMFRKENEAARVTPEEWLKQAQETEPDVLRLLDRGGRVVFVRLPSTDEHWANDEATFPRATYWDRWAETTQAETIHTMDVPSLAAFKCPDTVHLDRHDAPAFTWALSEELLRRQILTPGPRGGP